MTNLEFIKKYKDMNKISDFCKVFGFDSSNIVRGRSTKENEEKIATLCKLEIIKMYNEILQDNIVEINKLKNEVNDIAKTDSL